MEDGGDIDEDEMTGSIVTGTANGDENVELERDEFLEEPGGTPKKVKGKSHEESDENGTGEKMNLPSDTSVLSDNLTLNKTQAKDVAEAYEIKVGVKDTYAKALDKYNKKIGLTSLIEEEKELIKEVKRQKEGAAEEGADESTVNINLEFLSSKLKDTTDTKVELEAQSSEAFKQLFKFQESSKPKEDKEIQTEFKIGGKVYSQDQIVGIADKFGVDKSRAMDIVKKMEEGGATEDPGKKVTKEEADKKVADGEWESLGRGRYIKKGEPGTEFTTTETISSESRLDSYQKAWEEEGRVDKKEYPTFDSFANAAEEYWKNNPRPVGGSTEISTTTSSPGTPDELFFTELKRGKAYKKGVVLTEPEIDVDLSKLKGNLKRSEDASVNVEGEVEGDTTGDGLVDEGGSKRAGFNALLLPENQPLPPSALQLPTKMTRTFGTQEEVVLSPDQRLAELERGVDAAMAQIEKLPSGQKEAAVLQLQANKQAQSDKIIVDTKQTENATNVNIGQFNVRQRDRTQDANAIDTLDFERRAFGAVANTEDDFRRFFNTSQERNIKNFNTINSINLLNQASENFDFGNEGVAFTGGGAERNAEDLLRSGQFNSAVRTSTASRTTTKNKKKTKTARKGGRIRRK